MPTRDPVTYPVAWPGFQWKVETGAMELAVAEHASAAQMRPCKVTGILAACLANIDGHDATSEFIRRLSVGTREWLLQQVAAACRPVNDWHEIICTGCQAPHDITLDLARVPRTDQVSGFPVVEVDTDQDPLLFEVPNGAHEEALAASPDAGSGAFLAACALNRQTAEAVAGMTPQALRSVEAALDTATPETTDTVSSACPSCGTDQTVRIDPLLYAFPPAGPVLRDVHLLSSAYSWTEASVLRMPTRRRRSYVRMVAADRGAA